MSRGVGRGRVEAGVEAGRGVERPVSQAPFKSWVYDQINSPILGLAWKGAPIAKLVWGHLPHLGYQGSNPLPAMLRVSGGPRATVCGMAGRGGTRVVGFFCS